MNHLNTSFSIDPMLSLVETLAQALGETGQSVAGKDRLAMLVDRLVHTMVKLVDTEGVNANLVGSERIERLADRLIDDVAPMIVLGDGYHLDDVNAKLWVGRYLVEALDTLVSSPLLTGAYCDGFSDRMHDQLTPLLRLAVRLADPDTFEFGYVPDAWVQTGARATYIAAQLSRVIAQADAKASDTRSPGVLAA